jgi:hypothetical protein
MYCVTVYVKQEFANQLGIWCLASKVGSEESCFFFWFQIFVLQIPGLYKLNSMLAPKKPLGSRRKTAAGTNLAPRSHLAAGGRQQQKQILHESSHLPSLKGVRARHLISAHLASS